MSCDLIIVKCMYIDNKTLDFFLIYLLPFKYYKTCILNAYGRLRLFTS